MKVLVADLTKAFPAKLHDTVARIESALDHFELDASKLYLLGRSDQSWAHQRWPKAHWQLSTEEAVVQEIENLLAGFVQGGSLRPDLVHVLSYNTQVLTGCGGPQLVPVAASHLSTWQPKSDPSRVEASASPPKTVEAPPQEIATETLSP